MLMILQDKLHLDMQLDAQLLLLDHFLVHLEDSVPHMHINGNLAFLMGQQRSDGHLHSLPVEQLQMYSLNPFPLYIIAFCFYSYTSFSTLAKRTKYFLQHFRFVFLKFPAFQLRGLNGQTENYNTGREPQNQLTNICKQGQKKNLLLLTFPVLFFFISITVIHFKNCTTLLL